MNDDIVNVLIDLLERNDDIRYVDNTLYLQCREYIKLYLLVEELSHMEDYETSELVFKDSIEKILIKMGVLLNEINVSLHRLKQENKELISNPYRVENFNYKYTMDIFAEETYTHNPNFKIRVHQDDVEMLDKMLNDMDEQIISLNFANHNLNNNIVKFHKILDKKISETTDENIIEVLDILKKELR